MDPNTSNELWSKLMPVLEGEGDNIPKNKILNLINRELKEDRATKEAALAIEQRDRDDSEQINRNSKVLWSVKETAVAIPDDDIDDAGDGDDRPKKKKSKREALLAKKNRNDPNAPPINRIPLPELRDTEKMDKITASREASKRLRLGPDSLPSICFYTLLNGHHHHHAAAICAEVCEDSSMLAAGFSDSSVRVWSLTPKKLQRVKTPTELETIDKESDDVSYHMMEDFTDFKVLHGHNGPVYAVSFSPDRHLLLSCSEDSTIRLWSLQTWTNICCYRGHCFPIWDVKFSPHGYYFATASHDKTARLWGTDQHQPLRIFVGHITDVELVLFHPNSNYVATGSSDLSVRMWDVLNGQCVRCLKGHKNRPTCLLFSNCGRFLISGGADKLLLVWDVANATLVAKLLAHHDSVYSLTFSREGTILASGGADDSINVWDFRRLIHHDVDLDDINASRVPVVKTSADPVLLGSYRTKSTNILTLHFSRRNLLMAAGIFH